jgi:hypothetical protein
LKVARVSTNALMNELVDGGGGGGDGEGDGEGFARLAAADAGEIAAAPGAGFPALGAATAGETAATTAASIAATASNGSIRVLRTGEPPIRMPSRLGR